MQSVLCGMIQWFLHIVTHLILLTTLSTAVMNFILHMEKLLLPGELVCGKSSFTTIITVDMQEELRYCGLEWLLLRKLYYGLMVWRLI